MSDKIIICRRWRLDDDRGENLNVGSLFSGIGGIEIGFGRQGFRSSWFVECEPYAQFILSKRFPEARIYGDITEIDFKAVPKVDILTGGFPCQDISNAGKRAGIEGDRSSLWKHYLRAISEIRPRYALIENVAALLSRGLDTVLCDLASIGYDAEWHCVSASSVGAHHRRDRIFIMAYANNCGCMDGQTKKQPTERREPTQCQSRSSRSYVENSICHRSHEGNREIINRRENEKECSNKLICSSSKMADAFSNGLEGFKFGIIDPKGWKGSIKRSTRSCSHGIGQWAAEPKVGRVADGVPFRVDRIKCLGNAVVPDCAEVFARAIKEFEERKGG